MLTASARDRFNFPMSIDRLSKGVGVAIGTRGGAGICGAGAEKGTNSEFCVGFLGNAAGKARNIYGSGHIMEHPFSLQLSIFYVNDLLDHPIDVQYIGLGK